MSALALDFHAAEDLGPWPVALPTTPRPVELSVIVPTFNECGNLGELFRGLADALGDLAWELIIVDDDSPDGTATLARRWHGVDGRIRVIQRIGRRGLSSACIEGWLASSAPYLAVMDADGQHDPRLLPEMLKRLKASADVVVGSRYMAGGSLGGWTRSREVISRTATRLVASASAGLTDPMSGFFALRREVFEDRLHRLSGRGFKILLDLVSAKVTTPRLRLQELPFTFGVRRSGESKFSMSVAWECLALLVERLTGGALTRRILTFGCVGAFGVAVHLCVLAGALQMARLSFSTAQALAIAAAITCNYTLNNMLTFGERPNRGWRWLEGLASFALICGSGAWANLTISEMALSKGASWAAAAIVGAAVGAAWNFAVTSRVTWRAAA